VNDLLVVRYMLNGTHTTVILTQKPVGNHNRRSSVYGWLASFNILTAPVQSIHITLRLPDTFTSSSYD